MDPVVRRQIAEEVDRVHALERARDVSPAALAAGYGQLGRVLQAYGLNGPAAEAYRAAQDLAPAEFAWPYYLGHVHRLQGDVQAAAGDFQRAVSLRKDDVNALLALSQVRLQRGEAAEAERLARRVLLLHPDLAAGHVMLAEVAMTRRQMAAAALSYERALRLQPEATTLHQPLAVAYRALGKPDLAERHLARRGNGKVEVADPLLQRIVALRRGVEADLEEGQAAAARRDFQTAADAFRRAVTAAPDDARAHANLGAALGRLGDTAGAIREMREALRLKPDDAQSHFNLGIILGATGDDDGAIREYEQAIRGNEAHDDTRFNLANVLRRRDRCREALPHYHWVVEHEPRQLDPRLAEITCLSRVGERAVALRRVEEALSAWPAEPGLLAMQARLLATTADGSPRDAARALKIARALPEPKSVETLETLAMALAGAARYPEAVAAQWAAMAEARNGGRPDVLARMETNLELYRQNQRSRDPGL
jgi:tetratricopeptide (TPR) repeat protein